jgi:hypothetical protein
MYNKSQHVPAKPLVTKHFSTGFFDSKLLIAVEEEHNIYVCGEEGHTPAILGTSVQEVRNVKKKRKSKD